MKACRSGLAPDFLPTVADPQDGEAVLNHLPGDSGMSDGFPQDAEFASQKETSASYLVSKVPPSWRSWTDHRQGIFDAPRAEVRRFGGAGHEASGSRSGHRQLFAKAVAGI